MCSHCTLCSLHIVFCNKRKRILVTSEKAPVVEEPNVPDALKKVWDISQHACGCLTVRQRSLHTCQRHWYRIRDSFLPVHTPYNMCFSGRSIPAIWKKSCIIPVPKNPVISCMNDLRPIALTSVPMTVCERLVPNDLKLKVAPHLDPMQFAYQKDRNTEDAILTRSTLTGLPSRCPIQR